MAGWGQPQQDAPQIVAPPGQPPRTEPAQPLGHTRVPIPEKEPAQLAPVTVGEHALDQFGAP